MHNNLSQRHLLFVQEYIIDLNATSAAVRAGYSPKTASQQGSRLLADPRIQKAIKGAIEKRNKRIEVSQDQVIKRLCCHAFSDIRNLSEWEDGKLRLKNSAELSSEAAFSISEVSETAHGLRVKQYDQLKALELLMRHKGMLSDKLNLNTGPELGSRACEQMALEAKAVLERIRNERDKPVQHVQNQQEIKNG